MRFLRSGYPLFLLCIAVGCTAGQAGAPPGRDDWQPEGRRASAADAPPDARAPEANAESLYQRALSSARVGERPVVLDALEAVLKAGACPTRTLTEPAFANLHGEPRFRALIREHAPQGFTKLVVPGEPGEPLHVSGVVRDAAGKPVGGALVYVYHTDQRGYYSEPGSEEENPRLFGYIKTGADGRYEFRTIRPGAYPDQSEPSEQHIHYEVTAPGFARRQHALAFDDDPIWKRPGLADDPFFRKHAPFPPAWAARVTRDADGLQRVTCDIEFRERLPAALSE